MTPQASTGKAPAATERVAAFTASTRIADIPPDVVHLGKKSIIDSLATGLSGSVAPGSVLIRRYVETLGCSAGSCMVIGSALRLPPRFAALANGTAMHIDDFDDTWQSRPDGPRARYTARMGVHPSGPVLSAVLAVAEGEGRSGADVLAACLVGVEVSCAVFDATDAVEVDNALHTTSSCALVGAAAGVANLRGLGEQDVRRMLGIACDQTGGLTAQAGTMAKSWHGGRAAESAIVAADLTELGFTAEESVLEHPGGYFHTNSPSIDYHQSMDTGESGDGLDSFRVFLVVEAGFGDFVFDGIHGFEDDVGEELLAHVVPYVFDRVELRRVWRQGSDRHGVRDVEGSWTVTGCAVVDHEDVLAVMPTGQFV